MHVPKNLIVLPYSTYNMEPRLKPFPMSFGNGKFGSRKQFEGGDFELMNPSIEEILHEINHAGI